MGDKRGLPGRTEIVALCRAVRTEVYHQSAQAIARLVLSGTRKTARKTRKLAT